MAQKTANAAMLASAIRKELHKAIVGMDEAIDALIIALLTNGHILIEGVPGLAKTYLAKAFAKTLGLEFKRIQFTSDILPSDILGSMVYNRRTGEFEFRPGPIFANIVLVDEINRAPPRSQSALLEAMQERQVTIEGNRYPLPEPFIVVATQNPIELEGTFPLPEAEMDRFMMRINLTFLDEAAEIEILKKKNILRDEIPVEAISDTESIKNAVEEVHSVYVHKDIIEYIVSIVRATRSNHKVLLGASPRAEIALLQAAKAYAAMSGRRYVVPDHVKHVAHMVLNHRIILKPEYQSLSRTPDYSTITEIIRESLESVEVPR